MNIIEFRIGSYGEYPDPIKLVGKKVTVSGKEIGYVLGSKVKGSSVFIRVESPEGLVPSLGGQVRVV